MRTLGEVNYPLPLVRINSSSALTHPWKRARRRMTGSINARVLCELSSRSARYE